MAREILGPGSRKESRASSGGVESSKDVHAYRMPMGPTSIGNHGPGLGGTSHMCGSQGSHSVGARSSGSAGLGGSNRGKGTNRRG